MKRALKRVLVILLIVGMLATMIVLPALSLFN